MSFPWTVLTNLWPIRLVNLNTFIGSHKCVLAKVALAVRCAGRPPEVLEGCQVRCTHAKLAELLPDVRDVVSVAE